MNKIMTYKIYVYKEIINAMYDVTIHNRHIDPDELMHRVMCHGKGTFNPMTVKLLIEQMMD